MSGPDFVSVHMLLRKLYNKASLELPFALENLFHFAMFGLLTFLAEGTILLSTDVLGLTYASLMAFIALGTSVLFWKLRSYVLRGLRNSLLLVLILILAFPLLGFVGNQSPRTQEVPLYSNLLILSLGVFSTIAGAMISWEAWMRVSFVDKQRLTMKHIVKAFESLPEKVRKDPQVVNSYSSLTRLCWLFANGEFSFVIFLTGSTIEQLLRAICTEKSLGVDKMVSELDLNVGFQSSQNDSPSFDVRYFWHNVRSKHAHSASLETVGPKQAPLFLGLSEPSEETARKSVGLLGSFLSAYTECCRKLYAVQGKE